MTTKKINSKQKRFNRVLSIIAWIFVGVALFVMLWFYLFSRKHISTNDAQVKQYITPIASQVAGYIQEIRFNENQAVKKGDTLVVIDNRELQQDVQIAAAELGASKSSVVSQARAVDTRRSNTDIILAEMEAAQVELWRSKQDFDRFKNLVKERAATQQQYETMEAKYKLAQANVSSLEKQVKSIEVGVEAEISKIAPVQNLVLHHAVSLQKARLKYTFSYIVAPYDGWVGTKNIQVGQLIKEGQALVQVVSKEQWIIANFKETQLEGIEVGKIVEVHADAYPKLKFKGKVESFSPAAGSEFALIKPNNATGNFVKIEQRFPVKIVLSNQSKVEKLRTGMNVEVAVIK